MKKVDLILLEYKNVTLQASDFKIKKISLNYKKKKMN